MYPHIDNLQPPDMGLTQCGHLKHCGWANRGCALVIRRQRLHSGRGTDITREAFFSFPFSFTWSKMSGIWQAMAPHSSTVARKIPWMEEPGRLQPMGSLKSQARLSDFTFTFHFHALEKEMATHSSVLAWRIRGWRSLVGCSPWGRTKSDTTEVT